MPLKKKKTTEEDEMDQDHENSDSNDSSDDGGSEAYEGNEVTLNHSTIRKPCSKPELVSL